MGNIFNFILLLINYSGDFFNILTPNSRVVEVVIVLVVVENIRYERSDYRRKYELVG